MGSCEDIGNPTLIDLPVKLDRGLWGLAGDIQVQQGTVAVITADGQVVATLEEGKHQLSQFRKGAQLQAYVVNTKRRTLDYESKDELYLQEVGNNGITALAKVNVRLAVYYRVLPTNAARLLTIENPINELCRETNRAVAVAIREFITFEELRAGGDNLADYVESYLISKPLKGRSSGSVQDRTGLTIEGVSPQAFTGADRINEQKIQELLDSRNPITSEWWIRNHPELYTKMLEEVLKKYLELGLDPSASLERPLNAAQDPLFRLLAVQSALLNPGMPIPGAINTPLVGTGTERSKAPEAAERPTLTAISPDRVDQEWQLLEKNKWHVDGQPGVAGQRGMSDGTFSFTVTATVQKRKAVRIQLHLPLGFEQGVPPVRTVYVDNDVVQFPAVDAAKWVSSPQLSRLVKEVLTYYEQE